jgi:hypothetical protein
MLLVADGLGVVALHPAVHAVHELAVGVAEIDLALRCRRRRVGLRARAHPAPVAHHAAPVVGLEVGVRLALSGEVFLQAALGLAQPGPPALAGAQLLGQLVAARVAVELVLGRVDRLRFLEDLARDLPVIEILIATGVRMQLRPVDRDHAHLR